MDIGEIQIFEVTESVWSSVLGLAVERQTDREGAADAAIVRGRVQISGAFEGVVTVESSRELARRAAAILFGVEAESATSDELKDTLGELTNIIAGNIKGLLPEPSRLSVPDVEDDADFHKAVQGNRLVSAVGFHCEGQPLRVALSRRDAQRS